MIEHRQIWYASPPMVVIGCVSPSYGSFGSFDAYPTLTAGAPTNYAACADFHFLKPIPRVLFA